MNVEIGTEAMQFPEKEYINEIFPALYGSSSTEYRYTKRQVDGPYLKLPVLVCHAERLLIDRKDSSPLPACLPAAQAVVIYTAPLDRHVYLVTSTTMDARKREAAARNFYRL
jgi:hypothetical protein